jgi:hypothetical protein
MARTDGHDRRARSRRLTVLALVLLLSATACGSSGDGGTGTDVSATGSTGQAATSTSSDSFPDQLADDVGQWLSGVQDPADVPLSCPAKSPNTVVVASGSGARGCLMSTNGVFWLRVQNLTRVPLTVQGPFIITWSVPPGKTVDVPIIRAPVFGQFVSYRTDLQSGIAASVVDFLESKGPPAVKWHDCAESLTTDCLRSGVIEALPHSVKFRGEEIPVEKIADSLDTLWSNKQLIQTWNEHQRGVTGGSLTLTPQA